VSVGVFSNYEELNDDWVGLAVKKAIEIDMLK
jgi:hypothetical protein